MSDTKKPVDPIFAHHSVVRERPQQQSSATTATEEGKRLRQVRKERGYTMGAVADALSVKVSEVSDVERGVRTSDSDTVRAEMILLYQRDDELLVSDAADHPNSAPPEATTCDDGKRKLTREQQAVANCLECKGVGFLNLFTGEPVAFGEAMPEPDAQRCRACVSIAEELLLLGVPPHRYLTPEERAVDQVEWRERVRAHIEETQRGKEATKGIT